MLSRSDLANSQELIMFSEEFFVLRQDSSLLISHYSHSRQ
jgi:hypothetical protein